MPVFDPIERVFSDIPDWFDGSIIYEDENIIVLNKPSGISVHAGSHGDQGVIEILRQDLKRSNFTLDLVHRLDKDTSGVLLIAKNLICKRLLAEKFKAREIKKTYLALLEGHLEIDNTNLKHKLQNHYTKVVEAPNGKTAITKVISAELFLYNNRPATLVKLQPETGRKHQLRVQCQLIGHPIVGDHVYGSKKNAEKIFLHAQELCYIDPLNHMQRKFMAPLPKEKQLCLNSLKNIS